MLMHVETLLLAHHASVDSRPSKRSKQRENVASSQEHGEEVKVSSHVDGQSEGQHKECEAITLSYTTPPTRQKHPTMSEMMQTVRNDIYDTIIENMKSYGGQRQVIVEHASVFDFRQIPGKSDPLYYARAKKALEFFVPFCTEKRVLKFDKATKTVRNMTVSLFEIAGLNNPKVHEVWTEFVTLLPVLRKAKEEVMAEQGSPVAAARAALNETPANNYYSTIDAYQTVLKDHGHRAPSLRVIILALLVFPTNSAGVERVFSATSWLKDERSNRKGDDTLNADLHVKFNDCNVDYSLL